MRLFSQGFPPDDVFVHPRHEAAQKALPDLILQLRAAANVKDGYELQQELIAHVRETEEARNAFSKAVKRMEDGKSPQPDAPEPQSGRDRSLLETWRFERDVCERVARQFRCVGDALAWQVFGFQRRNIIALCQNAPPGVWAGKAGAPAELDAVEHAYRQDGQFAILHDMTNCLRIGDVTIFRSDGSRETIEVKSDPQRSKSAQQRQIKAADDALQNAAPLPGKDRRARLFDLDVQFRTHLDLLALGTERAAREGIFAARLRGDRALLVADIYGCSAQGWTDAEFAEQLDSKLRAARRRAGLGPRQPPDVHATSMDSVSRDPQRVPFAAYPLHPVACARLIGDLAVFTVETSGPALAKSLGNAGFETRWVRPPGAVGDLAPGEVVMELSVITGNQLLPGGLRAAATSTLQMRRSALDQYLIELVDQDAWIRGMRRMIADPSAQGRPWPTYRGEDRVWL
ncbi:MAG TPA: hypothetical protein VMV92_05175 [Streptosporangiaceae bacterium]|nr:hypothetical protein [Streptosporangiaceae bacterium]